MFFAPPPSNISFFDFLFAPKPANCALRQQQCVGGGGIFHLSVRRSYWSRSSPYLPTYVRSLWRAPPTSRASTRRQHNTRGVMRFSHIYDLLSEFRQYKTAPSASCFHSPWCVAVWFLQKRKKAWMVATVTEIGEILPLCHNFKQNLWPVFYCFFNFSIIFVPRYFGKCLKTVGRFFIVLHVAKYWKSRQLTSGHTDGGFGGGLSPLEGRERTVGSAKKWCYTVGITLLVGDVTYIV